MRKITASVLTTAALAAGVFGGSALAATAPPHPSADRAASVDRIQSKESQSVKDRSRHESSSRDRTAQHREARGSESRR